MVSPRGKVVKFLYDDGMEARMHFKDYERAFPDHRRAAYEFATAVWAYIGNKQVADRVAEEVLRKLLGK